MTCLFYFLLCIVYFNRHIIQPFLLLVLILHFKVFQLCLKPLVLTFSRQNILFVTRDSKYNVHKKWHINKALEKKNIIKT